MKTILAAFLLVSLPIAAQSTAEADAKLSAALQRIYDRRHKEPVYAPAPPPVPVDSQSARINPYGTAQKFMRDYQPTVEEQMLAEMRRARRQAELDRQYLEQQLHQQEMQRQQMEQARRLEEQRRQFYERDRAMRR